MRDPKRIDETLSIIKSIWVSHPDLRLTQLIANTAKEGVDLYHLEDDDLVKMLKVTYLNQETTTGGW